MGGSGGVAGAVCLSLAAFLKHFNCYVEETSTGSFMSEAYFN